jgi:HlyD family secretion protein
MSHAPQPPSPVPPTIAAAHAYRPDPRAMRAANDFQPDAAAIEDAPVPLSAHAVLYVVLLLLIAAIAWSIIGTVDRIVVAPGKIATRTPTLVIQSFSTSRILEIDVKPGDHVVQGQVLAKFDPSFAQADVTSLQQKVSSLMAQTRRLQAELSGQDFASGRDPDSAAQAQIYEQEMSDYRAEMDQRDSRMAQIDAQIGADEDTLPGIRAQVAMANNVVAIQQRLQRQQAAAALDVMRAQSNAIDASSRLTNTVQDEEKLRQQRAEAVQEREAFIGKWRSDHSQQLVQARQDLSEAGETLNKANRLQDFTQATAPVDGIVQDVADRSAGSVLKEGDTLVTLVPDGAALYVDASVPARDVSYLKLGDTVRVKLESYPFQRFGTITGTLTVISPDSMPVSDQDPSKLIYRLQVKLDDPQSLAARGILLKPGLVASAEIKTGTRSVASYVLNPVLRVTDESLREP